MSDKPVAIIKTWQARLQSAFYGHDEEIQCRDAEALELRVAYEALQKDYERLLLTIEAMKIGQRVLQGAIQASSMTDSEWREKYMREVEGLNNEGDPIGGDPPSGLRHHVEALKAENEAQAKRIVELEKGLTEISEWTKRYTSKGHPISTVADRLLAASKNGDSKCDANTG